MTLRHSTFTMLTCMTSWLHSVWTNFHQWLQIKVGLLVIKVPTHVPQTPWTSNESLSWLQPCQQKDCTLIQKVHLFQMWEILQLVIPIPKCRLVDKHHKWRWLSKEVCFLYSQGTVSPRVVYEMAAAQTDVGGARASEGLRRVLPEIHTDAGCPSNDRGMHNFLGYSKCE